ncbi:hypothetical protein EGM88_08120 [Aureibaculum marinum]|uniref:DM13 domain-containing protein n=1 Tax=Aureibaculum marinum TaxID=2487930 RepID=A0A3N4NQ58_9FLAO|nr:DM13 domain-containing protein [Aureibaculum marinum]RPD97745.1 hypothetical protein EGM88_08120 [Aureibaculum marinum]
MKNGLVVLFLVALFTNCSSSSEDMQTEFEMEQEMEETIVSKGSFVSGAHVTSGNVAVSSDGKQLNFTNFKTDNGPKLLVYLTTNVGSSDFVSLGDLKGIQGNYTYAIPSNTDISKYKIVDIWCVDFSVSFGHAELK